MQIQTFWILITVILVLGGMIVAATVLMMRSWQLDERRNPARDNWFVEMWSIGHGYQVQLHFPTTCILGRNSLPNYVTGRQPVGMDPTISREHVMLYEQDGMILAWNMSAVNPAAINGFRLNQPVQLVPGDRLELGNSVFLVTRVERA